jgi:hypothetical protein
LLVPRSSSPSPEGSAWTSWAPRAAACYSEADPQQAFAWEARVLDPSLPVRLETRPEPGVRLDLLLASDDGSAWSAVELQYLVRL